MTRDESNRLSRLGLALLERLPSRTYGHVVVVTSALPGEGKTFVSGQLSTRLGRVLRAPVAQIDAAGDAEPGDTGGFAGLVRRGRLPADLGLVPHARDPGPSGLDSTDSVIRMGAGTRVLPALFQLDGVGGAIDRLRQRFRLSIVDAPVLTDCGALLWHADAIVVVVDAEATDPRRVREAMAEASLDRSRCAGIVLNRARRDRPLWQGPR